MLFLNTMRIVQSTKELRDQIIFYNLHALHTFVVSIHLWSVGVEAE